GKTATQAEQCGYRNDNEDDAVSQIHRPHACDGLGNGKQNKGIGKTGSGLVAQAGRHGSKSTALYPRSKCVRYYQTLKLEAQVTGQLFTCLLTAGALQLRPDKYPVECVAATAGLPVIGG